MRMSAQVSCEGVRAMFVVAVALDGLAGGVFRMTMATRGGVGKKRARRSLQRSRLTQQSKDGV